VKIVLTASVEERISSLNQGHLLPEMLVRRYMHHGRSRFSTQWTTASFGIYFRSEPTRMSKQDFCSDIHLFTCLICRDLGREEHPTSHVKRATDYRHVSSLDFALLTLMLLAARQKTRPDGLQCPFPGCRDELVMQSWML
jgi:hypothetical protein